MKIAGIIAEYNPFHNGHKFHLEQVKKITGADYVIVVMSGDFTQRGTPAIIDKYSRAKMAVSCGADLVLEIPAYYACGSAEYFAEGAIDLLDKLGICDSICFGSECGDITKLETIATVLAYEPDVYKKELRHQMRLGKTFPVARNIALEKTIPNFTSYADVIGSPNNILGIEYIKAILKRGNRIAYYTNQRIGSGYHDYKFSDSNFSSAISIRQSLAMQQTLTFIKSQIPPVCFDILEENFNNSFPLFTRDFSALLKYRLLLEEKNGFDQFVDITKDLSDRIVNNLHEMNDFDSFCELLKTKDLTYARVSRCLGHILLDMKKKPFTRFLEHGTCFYGRVLGFREESTVIMKMIKENGSIPLISKAADAKNILDDIGYELFEKDIQVSHIYSSITAMKYDKKIVNEFQQPIIKL